MIVTISISERHLAELEKIAKEYYPREACALLEGTVENINDRLNEEHAIVHAIIPMRNADVSISSFSIDSTDLINAYREISSHNMNVVGIFHSHSSKAYPSLTDRKYMELNPVVWLIYSTQSHSFSAYIIDGTVVRIKLESSFPNDTP